MRSIYSKGDISPRFSNSVLDQIINSDLFNNSSHRVFAYCYLGVISFLKYNNKYDEFNLYANDIKKLLGYSPTYPEVDYIFKKNGVLHQLNLIETIKNPNKARNRVNVPINTLDELEECHTFNLLLFFKCMSNPELKLTGFFIGNYIREFQGGVIKGETNHARKVYQKLGISKRTFYPYINELIENDIISKTKKRSNENFNELNIYLRSKLNDWRSKSFEFHEGKCFVTGKESDIVVHHLTPFNTMRDFSLSLLNINDKQLNGMDSSKLSVIEDLVMDYHKLSIGVPLYSKIHDKFHREYGNHATIEDLLEFKYDYSKEQAK